MRLSALLGMSAFPALLCFACTEAHAAEFLIKTDRSSTTEFLISRFGFANGLLVERTPLLTTAEGSWYVIHADAMSDNVLFEMRNAPGTLTVEKSSRFYPEMENIPRSDVPPLPHAPELPYPPVPNPLIDDQYALQKINVAGAWKVTTGSKKVIVADVDTGIDYTHENLMNNLWHNEDASAPAEMHGAIGYDFLNKSPLPWDDNMHGTLTAGLIGAVGDNGVGISGVAKTVQLMILKFMGNNGGSTEDAILAINYAIKNGAHIINASWGGDEKSQALSDAIEAANDAGILFVAAAGNKWSNTDVDPHYPGSFKSANIITVAATDEKDVLPWFSNYGPQSVHLAAPGVNVLSTSPGNDYKKTSGTSFSAPIVSGAAALLKAAYPQLKAKELKQLILDSVDPLTNIRYLTVSGGRLNVGKAFQLAAERYPAPIRKP